MIMHIVTFSWHEGTTDDQVTVLTHALDALVPLVPELGAWVSNLNRWFRQ